MEQPVLGDNVFDEDSASIIPYKHGYECMSTKGGKTGDNVDDGTSRKDLCYDHFKDSVGNFNKF